MHQILLSARWLEHGCIEGKTMVSSTCLTRKAISCRSRSNLQRGYGIHRCFACAFKYVHVLLRMLRTEEQHAFTRTCCVQHSPSAKAFARQQEDSNLPRIDLICVDGTIRISCRRRCCFVVGLVVVILEIVVARSCRVVVGSGRSCLSSKSCR